MWGVRGQAGLARCVVTALLSEQTDSEEETERDSWHSSVWGQQARQLWGEWERWEGTEQHTLQPEYSTETQQYRETTTTPTITCPHPPPPPASPVRLSLHGPAVTGGSSVSNQVHCLFTPSVPPSWLISRGKYVQPPNSFLVSAVRI